MSPLPIRGSAFPNVGDLMSSRRARAAFVAVSLAAIASTLGGTALSGQSALARPNVAVTRVPSMPYRPTPGDFNNDGRIDLVAGRPVGVENNTEVRGELVVRLGNGDGTFGEEHVIATPAGAFPLGVGDFNGDGPADVTTGRSARSLDPAWQRRWHFPPRGDRGRLRPVTQVLPPLRVRHRRRLQP
jgi:hypothetical protein